MGLRIFLTGASSGLSRALLPMLCRREDVAEVIGLDLRPAAFTHPKFRFQQGDMRAPDLAARMQGCDAVVHTAFAIMRRERSEAEQHDNNVAGSLNVFRAADAAGVPKVINMSSVSVYGCGKGIEESRRMRPSSLFTYACHKAEIERLAAQFHPQVVHLRAHLIFGPHAQPFLQRMSRSAFCITTPAPQPLLQVVHEDDVARAILCCLERDVSGPFNLAAPQEVALSQLVRHGRRFMLPVPLSWVRAAVALARRFGNRDEYTWLDVFNTTLTVDCRRAGQLLGWHPAYSAWQACQAMRDGGACVPAVHRETPSATEGTRQHG